MNSDASLHQLAADLRVTLGQVRKRLVQQASMGDFGWRQMHVLVRLEREGPITVTALAQAEGMRSQSMGEMVAGLKSAGLIAGLPDPEDGRRTLLSLTPACIEALHAGRAAREDWLFKAMQSRLDASEQKQLADALPLLRRLVDN
jgi:DNA-binding MarR family transcriptional regulator